MNEENQEYYLDESGIETLWNATKKEITKHESNGGDVTLPEGPSGKDGITFTPSVSDEGIISWTNDGNLPNPNPVDIKGPKGDDGDAGSDGATFTPHVSEDGVLSWTNNGGLENPNPVNIKGPKGDDGQGTNGETSSLEIYSTEETRIGMWIDEKPLYRRVITGLAFLSNKDNQYADYGMESLSIDTVAKLEGIATANTGEVVALPYTGFNTSAVFNVDLHLQITNAALLASNRNAHENSKWNTATATAILEYTKTTD